MRVAVNGARLYVDVEGAGLVPDGPRMRERSTLVLVHGGPGFDHTAFKPAFSALTDLVQVVHYDHRGNGRSTGDDPATWTLAQLADDLHGLCEVLGIERPIVLGMSFGGYVAQAYATRYPDHPGKLVLVSTAARVVFPAIFSAFERLGGPEARRVAEAYWTNPTAEGRAAYRARCLPLYRRRPGDADWLHRATIRDAMALHFNGPDNAQGRMDFRADLARVRCPTLVMAGEDDPIAPPAFSETLAACLPPHRVRFERFADCGHGVFADQPERAFAVLRAFIAAA